MKALKDMDKAETIQFGEYIKDVRQRALIEAKELKNKIGTVHEIRLHKILQRIPLLDESLNKAREHYKKINLPSCLFISLLLHYL